MGIPCGVALDGVTLSDTWSALARALARAARG